MRTARRLCLAALFVFLILASGVITAAAGPKALFDNTHAETAGNADWEIDTHQPIPSPDPSGIGPDTPGTYWVGAISSWAVDLVKRGYTVATLTSAYGITYQNAANPYDLSNYDVFIVDEPNTRFTAAESTAIFHYVQDGGGLVAISDHYGSDRNNDGIDSPAIWNAVDTQHLWGVHFAVSGDANNNISQTSTNVNPSPSDSVTRGPVGNVTGFAFHNGSTMTLYPAINPTVRGEVWMTGLAQTSTTGLMAASSVYGNGRIVFASDSSPADDGSAAPGNSSIFDGWGEAPATDSTLFLNGTLWVTRQSVDVTPPNVTVTAPGNGTTWGCGTTQTITWTATDNVGVTSVDIFWSPDGGTTWYYITTGYPNTGSGGWNVPAQPATNASMKIVAHDAAGNTGTGFGGPFTIADQTPPSAATIRPIGGEMWNGGDVHTVQWTASDNVAVDSVNVDYSTHGADGPWVAVAHGLTGTDTTSWTLPLEPTDSALVRITAYDGAGLTGTAVSDSFFHILPQGTAVPPGAALIFAFAGPAPNPGLGGTTLRFSLPGAGSARLEILDVAGRVVWADRRMGPGRFAVPWYGRGAGNAPLAAGLYFARLTSPWGTRTARLLLLR